MVGRWFIIGATIWASARFLPGIEVTGGYKTYLWIALLFGLINALLEIVKIIITMPFGFLPPLLAIPSLIIVVGLLNAGLLILIAQITHSLWFDSFGSAFLMGTVVSVVRFAVSPSAL